MEAEFLVHAKSDYNKDFDPQTYNAQFYEDPENFKGTDLLYDAYISGSLQGEKLLDIATGPSLFSVIPATNYFNSIILTDYSSRNLEYLRQWIMPTSNDDTWDPFFKFMAGKKGERMKWREYKKELKRKIVRIQKCDITLENPLSPHPLEQFDVVSSCYTIECPSENEMQFQHYFKNISALVKPGGKLVMLSGLQGTYYAVGDKRFDLFPVTKKMVVDACLSNGLVIDKWEELDENYKEGEIDFRNDYFLIASKPTVSN